MGYIYHDSGTVELNKDEIYECIPRLSDGRRFLVEECTCVANEDFICMTNGEKLCFKRVPMNCKFKHQKVMIKALSAKTKITITCHGDTII